MFRRPRVYVSTLASLPSWSWSPAAERRAPASRTRRRASMRARRLSVSSVTDHLRSLAGSKSLPREPSPSWGSRREPYGHVVGVFSPRTGRPGANRTDSRLAPRGASLPNSRGPTPPEGPVRYMQPRLPAYRLPGFPTPLVPPWFRGATPRRPFRAAMSLESATILSNASSRPVLTKRSGSGVESLRTTPQWRWGPTPFPQTGRFSSIR